MRTHRLLAAAAVFCVAYTLRFAYLGQIAESPFFDFLQLDPLYYYEWAKRIAAGDWIGTDVFEMSPLYSYLLAVFFTIFGEDLRLLRLMQIGVGALTCVLTLQLAGTLFGRREALLAGLGCAAYAPFFFYEGQVMKEFLTPPLATAALLLLLKARGEEAEGFNVWPAALAGALIGLAALVRDNFLVLLAIMAGWMLYESRRLMAPAPLLAGAMLVLLPVGLRNAAVGGDFVLTTSGGGEVFYIGNGPFANGAYVPPPWVRSNPRYEHEDFRRKARELTGRELSRAEASRYWWLQGAEWIAANPGRAAMLWLRKLALFWNDHELPDNYSFYTFRRFSPLLAILLTFGPVAALGWAGIVRTAGDWRRLLPLYLAAAGYMLSVLLFFNFARFRLPVVPILLVFAARGVTGLLDSARTLRRGGAAGLAAGLATLAVAVPLFYIDWSSASEEPFQDRLHLGAAYRQAGRNDEAERIFRQVIDEAEALIRRHGGDPARPDTVPGGVTFRLALAAAWRDLGSVQMDQNRPAEAVESLRSAAGLAPQDPPTHMKLGSALQAAGRLPEAALSFTRAVELDSTSFAARFDLATVYYRMGRLDEAAAELERARAAPAQLGPLEQADYHYGIGAVLYATPGREEEAAKHFREALRLNPDADQAGEVRDALRAIEAAPRTPRTP
ncbi:MAG TPA: tetratricopeptide repeat protein [Candidatus Polarisedimenticolia bacterium]|nr:tetratricopeptide repeat protein [Candidatus Polarisedimenticolia bacterium]